MVAIGGRHLARVIRCKTAKAVGKPFISKVFSLILFMGSVGVTKNDDSAVH